MRRVLHAMAALLACLVLISCSSGHRSEPEPSPRAEAETALPAQGRAIARADSAGGESESFEFAAAEEAPAGLAAPAAEEAASAPARAKRESDLARRDPGPDPPGLRSGIQSGTLTAGSFDDNERFDDYQQFLAEAMQEDFDEQLPRVAIGQRVMIHVSDGQGGPVGDARVVVRQAGQGMGRSPQEASGDPVLLDLATASDGRAMFLTGLDGAAPGGEFLVTVHPPEGGKPVSHTMHLDQAPWRIALPKARARLPKRLDLALVVDTTGSMSDELEYLKVEIDSIAKSIYQQFPNVDQRYSLVVYRDDGDQYVTRSFDFTGALAEFRETLSEQSANGGGNYPESMHLALESAGRLDWRDRDTARVLFLVADAPPHDRFAGRTLEAVERLRGLGVRVFPVAASGTAMKAEFVMRAAGFLTLGQYLFLTDHSGVGNPHAEPHVPDYQVERLDRLMIRMVASELAGRRLAADEVIALEGGDPSRPRPEEGPHQPGQEPNPHVSAVHRAPSVFSTIPRWVVLVAAVVGLCVVDSLMTRGRS